MYGHGIGSLHLWSHTVQLPGVRHSFPVAILLKWSWPVEPGNEGRFCTFYQARFYILPGSHQDINLQGQHQNSTLLQLVVCYACKTKDEEVQARSKSRVLTSGCCSKGTLFSALRVEWIALHASMYCLWQCGYWLWAPLIKNHSYAYYRDSKTTKSRETM